MKKTICIDFDGVLHSYTSGWQGAGTIADPPVPGAIEWLVKMAPIYDIAIYSSRSKNPFGWWAMRQWIRRQVWNHIADIAMERIAMKAFNDNPYEAIGLFDHLVRTGVAEIMQGIRFPLFKPAAWVTIDDRAIMFNGWFPSDLEIDEFRPWYRRGDKP